jgi:class 3 adenylate cyclase
MEPPELTKWLNRYLNEMSNILLSYGGTLDKFEGDGIMAFFGDPTSRGEREDAKNCVLMAIEMQKKAAEMGIPVRIGIDTGLCTVGNFGSDRWTIPSLVTSSTPHHGWKRRAIREKSSYLKQSKHSWKNSQTMS